MKIFKLLTLLIIGLLVFGSAGYFGYELFVKPSHAEKVEKAAEAAAPTPTATPDPSLAEFKRLKALLKELQNSGKVDEVHDGLTNFIAIYPQSPLLVEARQCLGEVNMNLLFQPGSTNVASYTVVKGDSLARIATKHQCNAELIQKANALPGINLQIGEQLVIPSLKISLEIDRSAKTITLLNNGIFLKEYTLLSVPSSSKQGTVTSKVLDKVAIAGNKRIAFGDKAYPQSERTVLLMQAPPIVAPAPSPNTSVASSAPQQAPPLLPGGYVISASDLLEIFPLLSRNTSVIIH
jgi:LysM repeat protein